MSHTSSGARLLDRFIQDAVADDYPADESNPRRRIGPAGALLALVIGVLVTVALLQHLGSAEQRQQTRDDLVSRITDATSAVEERSAQVEQVRAEVSVLAAELAGDPSQTQRLETLSPLAALTPVSGPGVIMTMDDAPAATSGSLGRVLDRDIQDVVNALWQSGATAIAVNGTRLTQLSAIRSAGDAILVDYVPMTRPYRIQAAGVSEPDSGTKALLDALSRDYGLVIGSAAGDVQLPAGDARSVRFATPVPSAAPTPAAQVASNGQ